MKTIIYLILTAFIATGAYLAGLNSSSVVPGALVTFVVWGIFFWGCIRRARKRY